MTLAQVVLTLCSNNGSVRQIVIIKALGSVNLKTFVIASTCRQNDNADGIHPPNSTPVI